MTTWPNCCRALLHPSLHTCFRKRPTRQSVQPLLHTAPSSFSHAAACVVPVQSLPYAQHSPPTSGARTYMYDGTITGTASALADGRAPQDAHVRVQCSAVHRCSKPATPLTLVLYARVVAASTGSMATHFCTQLDTLMSILASTERHYVRCFKPSPTSTAGEYEVSAMTQQLQCAGVLAAIKIARQGQPLQLASGCGRGGHKLMVQLAHRLRNAIQVCGLHGDVPSTSASVAVQARWAMRAVATCFTFLCMSR